MDAIGFGVGVVRRQSTQLDASWEVTGEALYRSTNSAAPTQILFFFLISSFSVCCLPLWIACRGLIH